MTRRTSLCGAHGHAHERSGILAGIRDGLALMDGEEMGLKPRPAHSSLGGGAGAALCTAGGHGRSEYHGWYGLL
eukprot:364991-Chlamydomonas_euryale.AAC.8